MFDKLWVDNINASWFCGMGHFYVEASTVFFNHFLAIMYIDLPSVTLASVHLMSSLLAIFPTRLPDIKLNDPLEPTTCRCLAV